MFSSGRVLQSSFYSLTRLYLGFVVAGKQPSSNGILRVYFAGMREDGKRYELFRTMGQANSRRAAAPYQREQDRTGEQYCTGQFNRLNFGW